VSLCFFFEKCCGRKIYAWLWVHVKVVGKNKSFKEREKDGILFGETKV